MRFIVLDGLDGSGKDTQARNVAKYLAQNDKVIIRSHPAEDNPLGRKARRYLQSNGKKAHLLAALFYIGDVLRSTLYYYRPGRARIIFVRYLMGVAYVPTILMQPLYSIFAWLLPTTNCLILVDVKPEVARERILQRGEDLEMFESEERLKKQRRKMYQLAIANQWIIVDGNESPTKTWKQIEGHLKEFEKNDF
ncbi:MAG: thymidylate kinase [Candidatus Hodarchaeales archaeon]|jgi:dTMP kinase